MQPQEAALEKRCLVQILDNARQDTLAALDAIDPEKVVHSSSGWRVKDLVGHIVFWEEEALASLLALKEGKVYTIAEFISFDAYNDQDFKRRRSQPFNQILSDLHTTRERLKMALLAVPPERFSGIIRFPWPWQGTLTDLIMTMAAHEREHAREILRVAEAVPTE